MIFSYYNEWINNGKFKDILTKLKKENVDVHTFLYQYHDVLEYYFPNKTKMEAYGISSNEYDLVTVESNYARLDFYCDPTDNYETVGYIRLAYLYDSDLYEVTYTKTRSNHGVSKNEELKERIYEKCYDGVGDIDINDVLDTVENYEPESYIRVYHNIGNTSYAIYDNRVLTYECDRLWYNGLNILFSLAEEYKNNSPKRELPNVKKKTMSSITSKESGEN